MMLLLESYKNHILYCSIYISILVYVIEFKTNATKWWRSVFIGVSEEYDYQDIIIDYTPGSTIAGIFYLLLSLIAIGLLYFEINYMIKRIRLPPGDSGLPIIGHLLSQWENPEEFMTRHYKKYGPINTFNLMMIPVVMFANDEDANWVLTQERKGNSDAFIMKFLQSLLGTESIMLKSGEEHKRLRKIFEPAFTPKAIKDYASTIDKVAQETLQEWSEKPSDEFMPPNAWANLTMKIFFICAFGDVNEDLLNELIRLFDGWVLGFTSVIPFPLPGSRLQKALVFKDKLGDILKEMTLDFKAKNPPGSPAATHSVLGRLCYSVDDAGNPATEAQLVDNLRFALFAGYDTTKGSFGAFAHFITKHLSTKTYNLLIEEAKSFKKNVDPSSSSMNYDDLKNNAPILNAFMAEAWRLTPPVNSHGNITTKPLHYKGYTIPKGVVIAMNIQGQGFSIDEKRFPNPHEFRIERWLPKDHPLYDPKFATGIDYNIMSTKFRAFNAGRHACLGSHFAKLEVRIILTRLLQTYDIEVRNEKHIHFPLKQRTSEFKLIKRE